MNIAPQHEKDPMAAAPTPERLQKLKKVAILTTDDTEDLEFFYPCYRLNEAGYQVDVVTPEGESFTGKHKYEFKETKPLADAYPADYELVYIPGGDAPEKLRSNEEVLDFVREFATSGKPIAAICHGAQVLVSAGLIEGKRIAAWPEIKDEVEQAGATFVDEALVEDGQFITARMPGDLHRHMYGVINQLEGKMDRKSRSPAAA